METELKAWMIPVGTGIISFILLILIREAGIAFFKKQYEKTDAWDQRLLFTLFQKTHWVFLLTLSLYFGSLVWPEQIDSLTDVHKAMLLVALLWAGVMGTTSITLWSSSAYERAKEEDAGLATALGILKFFGLFALWTLVLLVALENMDVDVGALVAGLGVGGIAIALATQKILGDLFASLTIVLDKPFVIGDFIIAGQEMGTVEHIGLKSTRIKSVNGERLIIPNSDLLDSRVRNFKNLPERRQLFMLNVVYGTPKDKLQKIPEMIKSIIEGKQNIRFDRVFFKEYGPHSLNFEIVYWVTPGEYKHFLAANQDIFLDIYECFDKEGIEFAYPTQTIVLNQDQSQ